MTVSEPAGPQAVEIADAAQEALREVLAVIDVQPDPAAGDDVFAGTSFRTGPRIFGGQVLAQSLVAATKTVPHSRPVHSLHAYFLRPGDPDQPIGFAVERLRDGRSFSARRTHALQNGKPILSMISSFQAPSVGLDHQLEMPDVPSPDDLPTLAEQVDEEDAERLHWLLRRRPIEIRPVDRSLFAGPGPERSERQSMWMRATGPLPDEPMLQTALMAYASDYSLLEPVVRRHGLSWSEPGLRTASLDHAMWFHRPVRMDQWVLYTQESPSASGARGLGLGRIFSADGVLIASVAQEGMIRLPL
jgi:acyl-CoA thioesterase-2